MANVYLIIGEDDFLVSEAAKKALGATEGREVIDSISSTNADLQLADLGNVDASFSTPPFLDPIKSTWWKNVGFLPQAGSKGPSENVKRALEKFAKKVAATPLPDNQKLVISGPRLLMTSIFAKTLKTVAEVTTFSGGSDWEQGKLAVARALDFAAAAGFTFGPGVADEFVRRVGTDTRSLKSEIDKLRDYLGPQTTTANRRDIEEITSPGAGVEPSIWSVTEALGERNAQHVVTAALSFEHENGFAVLMTSVIEKFLRQLVELKDAEMRGKLDAMKNGMSPYAFKRAVGYLRHWSLNELRMARFRFLRLREKSVTSGDTVDALVITELLRVCRPRR